MKTIFIFLICLSVATPPSVFGQQLPLLTYYREHHALINPGTLYYENYTSNSQQNISVGAAFRQQWVGIRDAPRTEALRFEHVLRDRNMLYGGVLLRDEIGLTDLTGGYLRFAYQIKLDDESSFISIGTNVGYFFYRYQPLKGKTRDPNDLTAYTRNQQGVLDFSLGVFMNKKFSENDILYAGASIPQLLTHNFTRELIDPVNRYKHYYALLGYYHFFGDDIDDRSFIEPSVWLRYVPYIPLQIDANMRFNVQKIWVGAGVAMSPVGGVSFDIMHAEAGVRFLYNGSVFKIGYGTDISTNNASTRLGATHEINISMAWIK